MKNINYLILIASLLIVSACQKEDSNTVEMVFKKDKISGNIQKGPYINGASIMISELNSALNPTGKVFNTQIIDNSGSFELKDISLSTNFVELIANGFYFNENTGKVSSAQLTLHALSDLTDSSTINVNILTELEKGRVEYLISKGGDFKSAKSQAQKEILQLFEISTSDLRSSEYLDITKSGEDNSILLAISIIMQGHRTEAELAELVASISTDIKEDGILNNQQLGQKLISDVKRMNFSDIRQNIVSRYSDLGVTTEISDFEKYIKGFIDSTKYIASSGIEYIDDSKYGSNILSSDKSDYTNSSVTKYSVSAKIAKGANLKVIFHPDVDTTIVYEPKDNYIPVNYFQHYFIFPDNSGWGYNSDFYLLDRTAILYNTDDNRIIEGQIELIKHGSSTIEIYENNQIIPTRIKRIKW